MSKKPKPAVIYARISRADREDDGTLRTDGVDRQLERLRTLAADRGLTVVREIVENDTSATKGSRAGFLDLLGLLRDGTVSVVVAFGIDRLARRRRDLAELLDIAARQGVDLVLLNGADIAASTPAGRMVASMMGAVATSETETMSLRLSEGYRQRAQRGTHVPRQRTFGYSPGNLKADPREGPVVTEIFRRLADGDTVTGIVRNLTARGVVSTKGRPLSRQSLRVIATNPRYVGVCEYRQVRRDDDGREVARDLVGSTEGHWDALTDQQTYDRVQAILNDPRRRHERATVRHLLTGIATCGVCGTPLVRGMRRDRAGEPINMLQCPNGQHVGRTAAPIEAAVSEVVIERLASNAHAVADGYQDSPDVRLDLAALEDRRTALAGMFADGILDTEAYAAASKELAERITEAKAQLVAPTRDPLADVRDLADADSIRAWWGAADIIARRRVLAALFEVSLTPVGKGPGVNRSPLAGVSITVRDTPRK